MSTQNFLGAGRLESANAAPSDASGARFRYFCTRGSSVNIFFTSQHDFVLNSCYTFLKAEDVINNHAWSHHTFLDRGPFSI